LGEGEVKRMPKNALRGWVFRGDLTNFGKTERLNRIIKSIKGRKKKKEKMRKTTHQKNKTTRSLD